MVFLYDRILLRNTSKWFTDTYRTLDGAQGPRAKWGSAFSIGSEAAAYNTVYGENAQDRKQHYFQVQGRWGKHFKRDLGLIISSSSILALKLALWLYMFVKTPRTTPQKEELNIRNLDIVHMINSPTMVDGKLDNNGCGMHITGSPPPNFVEIEFSSGHAEMGPEGGAGHWRGDWGSAFIHRWVWSRDR